MPTIKFAASSSQSKAASKNAPRRTHQEHVAPAGYQSSDFYALVHKQVSNPYAIPEAKQAVQKEWTELEMKPAWDVRAVKPKAEVQARSRKNKVIVNFGRLMELCHVKNAELPKEYQSYKGRIVFRGDDIKDEEGF